MINITSTEDRLKDENAKLRAELETARAYARYERDIGAEEVAQANASLIQKLQDELAAMKAKYQPGMADLMVSPEKIDEFLDDNLVYKNLELLVDLQEATECIANLVSDIRNYESANNLAPNPGRKNCWNSVAAALVFLEKHE